MKSLAPLFFGLFALSSAARAETLPVHGIYPAADDEAAALNVISLEQFGGEAGPLLRIAIMDRLRDIRISGESWFQIRPYSANAQFDAVMSGSAEAEYMLYETRAERRVCVKEDAEGECVERATVKVDCVSRDVRFDASLRLWTGDGTPVHNKDASRSRTDQSCPNEAELPSLDTIVDEFIDSIVGELRWELAPVERFENIRVMEERKGLAGETRNLFRDAVKLTASDAAAACAKWAEIDRLQPRHLPTLFNLGLCEESRGDLAAAAAFYRQADEIAPARDYPTGGLRRIEARYRANSQLAAHYRE